jgi:hypothetical protein
MIIMPSGAFRRAVITGVTHEPVWADLSQKLVFLRYADTRCEATQKRVFVVYAYAEGCGQREDAWKRLFAGAETVESIPDFDECERYCQLKRDGALKTLGIPIRKDARKEKSEQSVDERQRKRRRQQVAPSEDEQLAEAAQAAEVRALRLATAEAMVQQRAAELEALEARVASFKEAGFGDKVQAARDHAALAKAREVLAKAKLQALQLRRAD